MADKWFVIRGKRNLGPFTTAKLKELATKGKLHHDDLVRRDDMRFASPAGEIDGLFEPQRPQQRSVSKPTTKDQLEREGQTSDSVDLKIDEPGDLASAMRARASQTKHARIKQIFGFMLAISVMAIFLKIFDAETLAKINGAIADWAVAVISHWLTWYTIFHAPLAIWVFVDANRRKSKQPELWGVGAFFLGMAVLPCHYASRNLRSGEVREGGFAWNVLRGFVLMWTAEVLAVAAYILIAVAFLAGAGVELSGEKHQFMAGAGVARFILALGAPLMFLWLCCVWLVPMVGAAAFGFFLKNNAIVERGPTGPLAEQNSSCLAIERQPAESRTKLLALAGGILVLVAGIVGVQVLRGQRGTGGRGQQEVAGRFKKNPVAQPKEQVERGLGLPDVGKPQMERKGAKVEADEDKRIVTEYLTQRFDTKWEEVTWWPAADVEINLFQPSLRVCRMSFRIRNDFGATVPMDRFFVLKKGRVAGMYDKQTDVGQACTTRFAELFGTVEEREFRRRVMAMAKDFLEDNDSDERPDNGVVKRNVPNRERPPAKAVANDKEKEAPPKGGILQAKKKRPIDPEVKRLMSRLDSAPLPAGKIEAADKLKALGAKAEPACEKLADLMVNHRDVKVQRAASEAFEAINPALYKLILPILLRTEAKIEKCLSDIAELETDARGAFPVLWQFAAANSKPYTPHGILAIATLKSIAPDDKRLLTEMVKMVRTGTEQFVYRSRVFGLVLQMRSVDEKQCDKLILDALGPVFPDEVRLQAIKIVPYIGNDSKLAVEALRNARADKNEQIRIAAETALKVIEKSAAIRAGDKAK